MKYKIGSYIKIKKEFNQFPWTWYHSEMMRIEDINKDLYIINYKHWKPSNSKINRSYVYQDAECIQKVRKEKLNKILKYE